MKTKERVLLINDLAGYGKVALSAMVPVLSAAGLSVSNLPTALVSNTLDYGRFKILETTEYMRDALAVWQQLGFSFDIICTGFIFSEAQAALVADFCAEQKARGAMIVVDPIMGDDGRLYNGVSPAVAGHLRRLCAVADLVLPNMTEATLLTGLYEGRTVLTPREQIRLLDALVSLGAKAAVITSVRQEGTSLVLGKDTAGSVFRIPFDEIPVRFPGTGDLFSAFLTASLAAGEPLEQATVAAMARVANLIRRCQNDEDKYKGIPVEKYL